MPDLLCCAVLNYLDLGAEIFIAASESQLFKFKERWKLRILLQILKAEMI